jgi:hypothetical protein
MRYAPCVRSLLLLLVLGVLTSVPVFAQMETATLSGVISDPKGGVVPDVEVTATRIETGTIFTTKTNGAGIYSFIGLLPGHYHLTIQKPGFKEIAIRELELHVQDKLEQNFSLEIGSVSETITVTANNLNVNTTDASVSTVIDRNFVESLPLNGRSFNTLLQLTPGVVIATSASPTNPGQFSIAGQRTDANTFTVDGVSANFGVSTSADPGNSGTGTAQAFSVLGGTSSLVSVDDLQEFRILTSAFAPEFGRAPGGQVILSTRSGTNDLHGGVFDYFRNTAMDANNWFANNVGLPRVPEHHNDFGVFLGGPIRKDKTFFFFSYEGARLRLPESAPILVPSEYARQTASPQLAPYLDVYPLPNDGTATPGVYTSEFTGSYSNQSTLNATSVRIDHTFNSRFSIFGRYNDAPSQLIQSNFVELDTVNVNTRTLTVGMNMLVNNSVSASVRGNYSEQTSGYIAALSPIGGGVPLDPSLLVGPLPNQATAVLFVPLDGTQSYQTGPQARNRTRQMNFVGDVSIVSGKHRLKFGADYSGIFLHTAPPQNYLLYEIGSIEGFVTGPLEGQATVFGAGTNIVSEILSQGLSLYAQDTFQVTPRLTLTYGLRWELAPAPSGLSGTDLAAWRNTSNPPEITLAPPGTAIWNTTYGNFAPRVGIAYRLNDEGSAVLRAGFGMFYDTGAGSAASLAKNFPNYFFQSFPGIGMPVNNLTSYLPVTSLNPPYPFAEGFAPNLILPRSYQWNVALEKSFSGNQAISVTYVGQAGRNLLRQAAFYQPTPDFSSEFFLTGNDARSNYNALQVQYRKPLTGRLQALLGYTWSHSLDNASNDVVAGLSDTVISEANDYASSDFDVRQSFSGAVTYALPATGATGVASRLTRDWFVDGVVVARTGFPFNALVLGTSPDPGGYVTTRPDRVPGEPFWISDPTAPGGKSLNPAAFSVPSVIRQGTEGRNDIPGFGLVQVDLSLSRKFAITERVNLQFRADAFNAFNHPNFANPPGYFQFGAFGLQSQTMLNQALGGGLNALFQEGGPRSLQVSLKLSF